jgi:hypothetical protein
MPRLWKQEFNCTLEITRFTVNAETLQIVYRFTNGSTHDAFVFNLLYFTLDDQVAFRVDRNGLYVEREGAGVVLAKKVPTIPRGVRVEVPIVPCASKVPVGKALEEELKLPLPLKPWSPYHRPRAELLDNQPRTVDAAFELGFFLAVPNAEKIGREVRTPEGIGFFFSSFRANNQKILRIGPLPQEVPVLFPK